MVGMLLHSRIPDCLKSPLLLLQTVRELYSLLCPSTWHSTCHSLCLSFFLCPTFWLIESFSLPGTMQRTKMSLWGSISLDHFLWGCVTSWISRNLQWSSWKTRLLFPNCFLCQCMCFWWYWKRHLFHAHYSWVKRFSKTGCWAKWALLCIFKFPCSQSVWKRGGVI